MERVKKGEKYWYISGLLTVEARYETNGIMDAELFKTNNYFPANEYTPKMVEEMAKKLRAVLKGADVIEMPCEEKCVCSAEESNLYKTNEGEGTLAGFENGLHRGYEIGFLRSIEWLKSKIVK